VRRDPSPWLEVIAAASTGGPDAGVDPVDWRQRIAAQRQGLGEAARSARRSVRISRLPHGWPEPDADVVASLQTWRRETARATGVPAYVVLHDATVEALASLRPQSVEDLLAVPGLGPVKAGRYGPSLIALISDHAASA
jgi:ATP-dependent DNA helicase RecQ